ncbi:MAG: DNA polymerase III subunit beta [Dehalococcoidia bacterium]|nr:DNA polymerase III subunit beta [Dehalococcoidia bacterium]
MQLSCLQENLSRGLSIVQRAVATRTTLPITQNVMMSTDNSRLKLSATNLEIAISTWVGAQVEEEGSLTVPARLLTEFVNSLPVARIDVTSTAQPLSLGLSCARFEANINGQDAEDFPPIPTVDEGSVGRIDASVMRDAINRVAFAAATDDSRPVLTGIKVEMSGDSFTFAAADGFRLAVYDGKLSAPIDEDISFTVPARALQEVGRLISAQSDPVEFTVTPQKSQALFRLENVELVSQLVQGTFPNYRQLIPEGYDTRVVVAHESFTQATRAAATFARDGSGIVRLNVTAGENGTEGKLAVSSRAEELGENVGEIDATVEGDDSKIAFNSRFLSDVLDVLGDDEVALETTTPSSPGVIRPASESEGYTYTHVVMPMFVQW